VRLWQLLRRLRPALVHTRNYGTVDCQWVAALAGCHKRIHGEHGWDVSDLEGRNWKRLTLRRMCRPVIAHFVAVSKDIETWLQKVVGIRPQRITQIYNGVDTDRFSPEGARASGLPWQPDGADHFLIGTVGRLEPTKNQRALLDAFARLVDRSPAAVNRARLVVVGSGQDLESLRRETSRLGLTGRVWFPGARDDIPAIMRTTECIRASVPE